MPPPTPTTLGGRLRLARRRAVLTQAELAAVVPVHPDTLARWERDVSEPLVSQLRACAVACGVDVIAIIGAP